MDEGDVLKILIVEETGDALTLTLNTAGDNPNVDEVPDAVVALTASDITASSFTANWSLIENTLGFYLDVAEDSAFTSMVAGYDDLDVGLVTEYSVVGLTPGVTYYYRIRGYNDNGYGDNSNTITISLYNDIGSSIISWTDETGWSTFISVGGDITSAINNDVTSEYAQSNDIAVIAGQNVSFQLNVGIVSGDYPQFYIWDKTHNIVIDNRLLVDGVNLIEVEIPSGCLAVYLQVLNVIGFSYRVNVNFNVTVV